MECTKVSFNIFFPSLNALFYEALTKLWPFWFSFALCSTQPAMEMIKIMYMKNGRMIQDVFDLGNGIVLTFPINYITATFI